MLRRLLQKFSSAQSDSEAELETVLQNDFVTFQVCRDPGQALKIDDWYHHNRVLPSAVFGKQVLLLRQMVSDGAAILGETQVAVPIEELYSLGREELSSLEIAPPFPFRPVLGCESDLAHDDFRYLLNYESLTRTPAPALERVGCCFRSGQQTWLISPPLWQLLEQLKAAVSDSDEQSRLLRHARISKLLDACSGRFSDEYLKNLEIVVPDRLLLDLQGNEDELTVLPRVEHSANKLFQRVFQRRPAGVVPLESDGLKTKRLVFTNEQQSSLNEISTLGTLRGERKEKFLQRPELFISAKQVDFSEFPSQASRFRRPVYRAQVTSHNQESRLVVAPVNETSSSAYEPQTLSRVDALELLNKVRESREQGRQDITLSNGQSVLAQRSLEIHLEKLVDQEPQRPEKTKDDETVELPGTLKPDVSLLPHQLQGLDWLQQRYLDGAPGALLADDMGLGKTLQLLTFLEWLRHHLDRPGPSLIVAPIGLLDNWCNEYKLFFSGDKALSDADILPLFGTSLKTFQRSNGRLDTGGIARHPLVLTSYETLRSRSDCLQDICWNTVILDEAQKVKNPRALVTEAVKRLDTVFRVACTGTPVENSLSDLWCILDFASPGLLGERKDFLKTFEPETEAEYQQLGERLDQVISERFLRRRKQDVLKSLPPKHESSPKVVMAGLQREQYLGVMQSYREGSALEVIQKLRRLSCTADTEPPTDGNYKSYSAKLGWLIETLRKVKELGEKALVFVEYRDVQRIISMALEREFQIKVDMINGDVPTASSKKARSRTEIINDFGAKEGFNVLVLSPLAAGFGLTITSANHVIHFLRHWNPAKEDQATDRAYRIGQQKPVHVYYPAATLEGLSSFDERLGDLLDEKRRLAASAIFPSMLTKVIPEELLSILDPSKAEGSAQVTIDDTAELPRSAFLGVCAALLRKQGYDVFALEIPEADLLAFHPEKNSHLISVQDTPGENSELTAAAIHFQKDAPSKLEPLIIVSQSDLMSPTKGEFWSKEHLGQLLLQFPIYWRDIYEKVSFYTERQNERTLESSAARIGSNWEKAFNSQTVKTTISSGNEAPFHLQLPKSEFVIDDDRKLSIKIPRLDNLPRFVRTLELGYGPSRQSIPTKSLRHCSELLPVTPMNSVYTWTAPGFEDEVDADLEPLNLNLSDRLPTLFLRRSDEYFYRSQEKRVHKTSSYAALIPPAFVAYKPPEQVEAFQLEDWRVDTFTISEQVSQDMHVYLAHLGWSVAEQQTRHLILGPQTRQRNKVIAFSRNLLLELEPQGEVLAALTNGGEISNLTVENDSKTYLYAKLDAEGGYVLKISPRSLDQRIQTDFIWATESYPELPRASFGFATSNTLLEDNFSLKCQEIFELKLRTPGIWPASIEAVTANGRRVWSGDLEDGTELAEILPTLGILPSTEQQVFSILLHLESLGSATLNIENEASLSNLQGRFRQLYRDLREQQGLGTLPIDELENIFGRPLAKALGYDWKSQKTGEDFAFGCFKNTPNKGLLLVQQQLDLGSDELKLLSSDIISETGVRDLFVTNSTHWLRVRASNQRFFKRPIHLEAVVHDSEAFEDFLATYASEEL